MWGSWARTNATAPPANTSKTAPATSPYRSHRREPRLGMSAMLASGPPEDGWEETMSMLKIPPEQALALIRALPAAQPLVARLRDGGPPVYLVGGAVRDVLLGGTPFGLLPIALDCPVVWFPVVLDCSGCWMPVSCWRSKVLLEARSSASRSRSGRSLATPVWSGGKLDWLPIALDWPVVLDELVVP